MKNNFWNSIIQVFSTKILIYIFMFFSSIYLSRLLGPMEKGKLDVAVAMIGIGIQFGNLGLHSSHTYYISKDNQNVYKACGNIIVVVSVALVIAFIINIFLRKDLMYKIIVWIIPLQLMTLFNENVLLASGKIKEYNFIEIFANLFYPIATVIFSFFATVKSQQAFALVSLGYIIVCICSIFMICKVTHGRFQFELCFFKENLKYGVKAYIACLFSYLILKVDVLMINYLRGSESTGIYSLAVSLSDILYMVSSSVGLIAFPELGRTICMLEKRKLLKEILRKMNLLLFLLLCLAALVIRPVVQIAYGSPYIESVYVFLILLPGVWAMSNVTILNNFYASINKTEVAIFAGMMGLIVNIILNIFWIIQYGIIGAALASTCSYFAVLIVLFFSFFKRKECV